MMLVILVNVNRNSENVMRDWLENPDNYMTALWVITIVFVIVPVLAWSFYPPTVLFVSIFCAWAISMFWHEHLVSPDMLGLKMGAHRPQPTGGAAMMVRLRLATFGTVTLLAAVIAVPMVMGRDITTMNMPFMATALIIGILAATFSTTFMLQVLSGRGLMTEPVLNIIDIWIAVSKTGAARKAAHQKVYDLENRFFVLIAGYCTSFCFRSKSERLRENIPQLGK